MASRPMFYMLDGHALAYRHHFAHINNPLLTSSGEPTSAIFGFSRTLMDILEKEKPFYLAVSFDEGLSGRDELYSEYKGTREKMPDELAQQMIRIRQIVEAFNIPILSMAGYEADDLLGTASLQAEAQGVDVRIFTGDRDLLQLLTESTTVRLAIPQRGAQDEIYDVDKFRAKYALEPIQLIDLKALEGDTSDNIPGVAGIGRVGATKLLQQYPTIEAIYEHIDEFKGALQKKLIEGRESAFLSKQLATIRRDVPMRLELPACVAHDFDKAKVELLFRELEFGSMFNQLSRIRVHNGGQMTLFGFEPEDDQAEAPAVEAVFPTVIVQDMDALRSLVDALNGAQAIAFDVETTSTDQMAGDLVGISLSVDGETGYYIPLAHLSGDQLPLETVIDALRPPLTNPNIAKYAHNATYDVVMLQRNGIDVAPVTFDTMVAEWLRDPLSSNLSLKRLSAVDLGVTMTPISALIGTGKKQRLMTEVPIEQAAAYAAADAVCTYQLVGVLRGKLEREPDAPPIDPLWGTENPPSPLDVFNDLEMPLIPVVSALDRAGVLLDSAYLAQMSVQLAADLADLEQEIYTLGEMGQFNINSPKQLNDVLFGKLGLKVEGLRKTTLGYSTAADVLDNMRGEHPIIERLLQYRELAKLKGTYVDALPALVNPQTGRLHTSYNQTGTVTGRLSSSSPNLQNIPIRTDKGREVRRAFIAPPGKLLLAVDYSQVELRIMAHAAKEPALIESFHQGLDIHAATAALVNNIPLEQVTKDQRGFAKRVNFGLLYGMGAFRLARDSGLPLAQAEAFINTYFARLPRVKDYIENAKRIAREQGYLTTLYGRRRSFPGLKHGNRNIQQQAEREAINMPIQGTAADIIKKAMIDLYGELARRKLEAQMILQVHDELVLEVPERELRETAALVVDVMERACELDAPLRANAEFGQNWLEVEAI